MDKILLTLVKYKNKQEKKRTNSMFTIKDKIEYNKYVKTINVLEAYLELKYNLTI